MLEKRETAKDVGLWLPDHLKRDVGEQGNGVARLPKVLIGIPSRGVVPHAFLETMNPALIGQGKLFTGHFAHAMFYITDGARNNFVETALKENCDFVFFMDTDMTFPVGTLAQMIRHTAQIKDDKPFIMGGIYCNRGNDFRWHVYKWVPDKDGWQSLRFPLNDGLKRVDAIGTGCMLIDMGVFEVLKWPWFEYEYQMFEGKHDRLSEDMVFCKRAMEAGIPIYADTDIKCGHMQSVVIEPTDDGGYEVKTLGGDVI